MEAKVLLDASHVNTHKIIESSQVEKKSDFYQELFQFYLSVLKLRFLPIYQSVNLIRLQPLSYTLIFNMFLENICEGKMWRKYNSVVFLSLKDIFFINQDVLLPIKCLSPKIARAPQFFLLLILSLPFYLKSL